MSYRLESSRPRVESPHPRSVLSPLRIRSPGYTPSLTSPTTLLYDLPQSSSRSAPPLSADTRVYSPPLKSPPLPTSPILSRQKTSLTPPSHSRSATPAQVTRQELDEFASYCRAWYFDQDERAGQVMTQIVEGLAASQRAPFSRVQANTRLAYHNAMANRRRSEFRAHLSSTHPGGSLLPHARANPFSNLAKRERFQKFHRFLRTWCTTGMPGTRPFFHGLWALLRLQVLPVELGGAGSKRIEWELDDAIFQESAGKEFMLEAIDTLKGLLGFEENLPARSRQQSNEPQSLSSVPPMSLTRPRSSSDPFLDTPAPSHSVMTSASRSSTIASNLPSSQSASDEMLQPASPRQAYKEYPEDDAYDVDHNMRIWTTADLDNPELQRLISLFPEFVTRQTLPRFNAVQIRRGAQDLEEGHDREGELSEVRRELSEVRCGTGRLWIGEKERKDGWRGSWWCRFLAWWRRLCC